MCRRKVLADITQVREQSKVAKEEARNVQVLEQQQRRVLGAKQEKVARMALQHEAKVNSTAEDIEALTLYVIYFSYWC